MTRRSLGALLLACAFTGCEKPAFEGSVAAYAGLNPDQIRRYHDDELQCWRNDEYIKSKAIVIDRETNQLHEVLHRRLPPELRAGAAAEVRTVIWISRPGFVITAEEAAKVSPPKIGVPVDVRFSMVEVAVIDIEEGRYSGFTSHHLPASVNAHPKPGVIVPEEYYERIVSFLSGLPRNPASIDE